MDTYNKFLEYYDDIVRWINSPLDDEVEFLIEDCIMEYKPNSQTILEAACGTWTVAFELKNRWYDVSGFDINKKALDIAKDKLWEKNVYHADMINYDFNKKFDIILCNYNSICHLLKWEDWKSFFINTYNNLDKWWLFVFDINTIFEFENITRDFAQFYTFWKDVVCLEMFKRQKDSEKDIDIPWIYYEWLIKIFSHQDNDNFKLTKEVVRENSFAISKIEKELSNIWFKLVEKVDYHYWKVTAESERVYFICIKK